MAGVVGLDGAGRSAVVTQQVHAGGRSRRLQTVKARSSGVWWVAAVAATALLAVIVSGHGGSEDGTGGAAVALVLLCGGAFVIQRFFQSRIAAGFDREGIYSPADGWVPWRHVRRIEVRRMGSVVTGRRTVIWVSYRPAEPAGTEPAGTQPAGTEPAGTEPAGDEAPDPGDQAPAGDEERWLRISPGWGEARSLELCGVLERCWRAAGEPPPAPAPDA